MLNIKSKTICFIPARKNSKRIKDKNLKKIADMSLTEIAIKQAKESGIFKDIILSSDSKKILNLGKKYKITCFKRSKKNSGSRSRTDSALKETVLKIKDDYDNIVILQVTSPLRRIATIKKFTSFCVKKKLNYCLTVSKISNNIGKFKKNFFNPLNKKRQISQKRRPYIFENGLIYFISRKKFIENYKIFPKKNWNYFLTNKYESMDINTNDDYFVCKLLYNKLKWEK